MLRARKSAADPEAPTTDQLLADRLGGALAAIRARSPARASSLAVSAGTFLECSRAITPSRTARGSISRCTCAETFPDLQSLLLGQMDHGLIAIDDIEIALLPHE
ncbi:MAG TPA: hypothetical protein VIK79_07465 [Xanthobacteraceae bacterium]